MIPKEIKYNLNYDDVTHANSQNWAKIEVI